MTDKNDVTGDKLVTKPASDNYRDNWDKIFKEKKNSEEQKTIKDESNGNK